MHNIVNIEIVFDKPFDIKDSKPYLYEINPRPSANIMSTLYKNKTFIEDWILLNNQKKVKTKKIKTHLFERVYARIII